MTNAILDLFTGLIWLGEDAKKLGLIEGIADANHIAKNIVGIDSRILFEAEKTLLEW
jgi:protease-4